MPCLVGTLNSNRQIIVQVGVSDIETHSKEKPSDNEHSIIFNALIDTGATGSCISKNVVDSLILSPIGQIPMNSASHTINTNQYLVNFILTFGNVVFMQQGKTVMEFNGSNSFDVIIGMDVICKGSLNVTFDNRFVFCL